MVVTTLGDRRISVAIRPVDSAPIEIVGTPNSRLDYFLHGGHCHLSSSYLSLVPAKLAEAVAAESRKVSPLLHLNDRVELIRCKVCADPELGMYTKKLTAKDT